MVDRADDADKAAEKNRKAALKATRRLARTLCVEFRDGDGDGEEAEDETGEGSVAGPFDSFPSKKQARKLEPAQRDALVDRLSALSERVVTLSSLLAHKHGGPLSNMEARSQTGPGGFAGTGMERAGDTLKVSAAFVEVDMWRQLSAVSRRCCDEALSSTVDDDEPVALEEEGEEEEEEEEAAAAVVVAVLATVPPLLPKVPAIRASIWSLTLARLPSSLRGPVPDAMCLLAALPWHSPGAALETCTEPTRRPVGERSALLTSPFVHHLVSSPTALSTSSLGAFVPRASRRNTIPSFFSKPALTHSHWPQNEAAAPPMANSAATASSVAGTSAITLHPRVHLKVRDKAIRPAMRCPYVITSTIMADEGAWVHGVLCRCEPAHPGQAVAVVVREMARKGQQLFKNRSG